MCPVTCSRPKACMCASRCHQTSCRVAAESGTRHLLQPLPPSLPVLVQLSLAPACRRMCRRHSQPRPHSTAHEHDRRCPQAAARVQVRVQGRQVGQVLLQPPEVPPAQGALPEAVLHVRGRHAHRAGLLLHQHGAARGGGPRVCSLVPLLSLKLVLMLACERGWAVPGAQR